VTAHYKATGPSSYSLTDQTFTSSTAPPGTNTFYDEVPIPSNAPAGTYTLEASLTYNGTTSTQTATFRVTAGTASPVIVTAALTADTSGVQKTSFVVGQTVRLAMTRSNSLAATASVTAEYKATGPGSYVLVDSTVNSTALTGLNTYYIDAPIPATAPSGTYTFQASVTYNGSTSTQSATFTIALSDSPVISDQN
jgi:uncharacterized protein YfaS (alpha-2-macroglobulin family)